MVDRLRKRKTKMGSQIRYPILRLVALSLLGFGAVTSHSKAQQVSASEFRRSQGPPPLTGNPRVVGASRQLSFIENRGQFDPDVKYQAKSGGKTLWFTSHGLVFDVVHPVANNKAGDSHSETKTGPLAMLASRIGRQFLLAGDGFERVVFSEDFTKGYGLPKIEASAPQPGVYNYFIGSDPKNWRTSVVGYSQLIYHDVWPGIDIDRKSVV